MAYWDCPRCAAENSLDASCCWRCGFRNYGGKKGADAPRTSGPRSAGALERQRESIRADLRKNLEDAIGRTEETLDRLAGGPRSRKGGTVPGPAGPDRKSSS
jgi:hypothetical protein